MAPIATEASFHTLNPAYAPRPDAGKVDDVQETPTETPDGGQQDVLVGLEVAPNVVTLAAGETHQLQVEATWNSAGAENATDQCTWSSSNEQVATVDENGLVTAVSAGDATITAGFEAEAVTVQVTVGAQE